MPDEPHFPAPGEKILDPYREPEKPAPPAPSHKIVTRAEPPPSSTHPKRVALTREEIAAMATIGAAQRPWRQAATRSPLLIVVTIASILLKVTLGRYAFPFTTLLYIGALAWIARPLFRRDRFS